MKKLMKEILVILVLMALMINSSLLMIVSTALDAISEALDESKINSVLEMSLEKYVNYSLDEQTKGTLVQMNVKTGIEYAEGQEYKPLEYTETLLQAPKIEGEYPERVEFIAKSTKATNGDDNAKDIGYEYDRNSGIVRVGVQNKEDEQGNVYSENVNGARDEFVVLYYYGANCYNDQNVKRELEFKGKIYETIHNDDKSKIEKDYSNSQEVTENIGGLVSTNVSTSDLYNGYIYSNINNGTDLDTEYTENTQLSISYKEISDEIVINQNTKFIDAKDDEVDTQDVVYKGVKINKNKIVNVLGEDFKIYVLNDAGETIAEINKDTETDDSGIIDLNYDKEYTNVNFKVSKPVKAGYLQIENKKAIKNTMKTIENNKIKLTQEIICQNNIQEKDEQTGEVKNEYTKQVNSYKTESIAEIKNSESKIELQSDKQKLTNSTKNDVIFTAVLKTNEAKYNLFKNPVIEIEMPSEVDNVILGDVSLLYDGNLNIKKYEVQDRNGIKVIRIEIDGTQSNYSNSVISEGANIIIPATIIVNKDIYSTQSSIKIRYSNETGIVTSYANQGKDCEELQVDIDSMNVPVATYSANSQTESAIAMEGANSNVSLEGLRVETVAQVGGKTLKSGDIVYEKEVINYIVKVTNTTENEMNNVNVKATVPDGTTFIMKDGSKKEEGPADSTENRNDLEIKYEDKKDVETTLEKIEAGSDHTLKYSVIVNDINDGEQKNIENKIYINNNEMENKINLVAKKGKMKVDLYPATKEYGKYKNMYIFEVRVYNTSNEKITNAQLESTLATEMELNYVTGAKNEYNSETKKLKINVGDIEANSSKLIAIRLNALNFKEGISEYTIPFDLETYGDNTDTYRADTQYVKAYSADISVKMESPTEGQELEIGQEVEYNVTIKNTGTVNEYITVIDNLPENVIPVKAKYNKYEFNSEGTEIVQKEKEISLTYKEEIDGEQSYDFNLATIIPKDETINITIIGENDAVDKKTEVSNTVTVYGKETGAKVSNGIVHTILPYVFEEEGEGEKPNISRDDMYGKPSIDDPDENGDDSGDRDEPSGGESSDDTDGSGDTNNNDNKEYYISGRAWVDDNQDGKRDSDEELLKGVIVKLFNSNTNAIVTDKNGDVKKTETNDSGEYKFENIAKGNYLVIFEYDTNTYTTTKYQSSGVSVSTNSDAIAKEANIDGQNKVIGVTDILNITSSNIENIDIGLIKSQKFDFKLDKYVSKITVNNTDGTKEYSYKNSKLAKVEIASKKIANSTVQVEYKIVVTNEGELSGEINEIIDYLPDGMTFNSELNKGWYKGYDGNLRNSSLAEIQIKPGESKELTLILTKNLTETSIGMIENMAEIGNATNVNSVSDIDSTPGNKKDGEDDYSKAQVIISIKTGIVQSVIIISIILAILFVVTFVLKNKKLKKSIKFMAIFMAILFIGGYTFVAKAEETKWIDGFQSPVDIKYKVNNGLSHDNGVWIEKVKGFWKKGPAFSNVEWGNDELSPGFICISPGCAVCSSENHTYNVENVDTYYDWNSFYNEMSGSEYSGGGWIDVAGVKSDWFSQEEHTGEAGLKKKETKINVISDGEGGVICGPFKYTLDKDVSSDSFHLWVVDETYQLLKKNGDNYEGLSSLDGFNTAGDHEFYLTPITKSEKKINFGRIKVMIYIDGTNSFDWKGVKVAKYTAPDMCKLGVPQTFIRLMKTSKKSENPVSESIPWNVRIAGKLRIKKYDIEDKDKEEKDKRTIYAIKFKIKSNATGKVYTRWTDENGKIELENIPIGYYDIEEIASANSQYPVEIQNQKGITNNTTVEYTYKDKDLDFYNQKSYYLQIQKVDSKGNPIKGVEFIAAKQGENTSLRHSITDEEGCFETSLNLSTNLEKNKKNDQIFKIREMDIGDNKDLYLYPYNEDNGDNDENDKDYRPIVKIKYKGEDKSFWIVDGGGNDIAKIRTLDQIQKDNENRHYDYVYRYGTKIGFRRDGNKILLYFVNDEIATIGIRKINSETDERVNGAGFKIYFKGVDGNNYFIRKNYDDKYGYDYDKDEKKAKVIWTTNEDDANIFYTGTDYGRGKYNEEYTNLDDKGKPITDGLIILKGVPKKNYYAKEVVVPKGYKTTNKNYTIVDKDYTKYNYYTNDKDENENIKAWKAWFGDIEKEVNGKKQKYIGNEPIYSIGIKKVDSENNSVLLNGAKFRIFYDEDGQRKYLKSYKYNSETGIATVVYSDKKDDSYEFETGKDYSGETEKVKKGQIILLGMEKQKYYAVEVEAPNEYYSEDIEKELNYADRLYTIKENEWNCKEINYFRKAKKDSSGKEIVGDSKDIPNTQKYIDISGYVWLDENAEKATVRNNKYDDGETLLKRIKVTLKDKEGKIVVNEKNEKYEVGTDDNGRYKFEKVPVEKLANYYVEFEYNGLKYQNVTKEAYEDFTKGNTSKAEEKTRDAFNEKFAIIENHKSFDKDGNYAHFITYNEVNNHVSTVNFNGMDIPITSQTDIYNKDNNGSYLNKRYNYDKVTKSKTIYEIDNVNLGLYEREQPDMALIKDLENVELKINGYSYTYEYAQRFNNQSEFGDGFDIGVKFGGKYAGMTYKRPIYKSDVDWNGNNDENLRSYITYRIKVRNESTGLKTKINSLVDYYSKTYRVIGIGTKDENGTINYRDVKDSEKKEYNSEKYAKLVIDTTDDIGKIESGQSKDIYVKFELNKVDILNIIHEIDQEPKGELLNNTVEINSYSIFDKDDKIYAGLDKDSQPGNAIPGDVNTYEDDTDSAPGFDIVYRTNRTISGTVFEDKELEDKLKKDGIVIGNGKYDEGKESGISNIKVSMIPISKNNNKTYITNTVEEEGWYKINTIEDQENKVTEINLEKSQEENSEVYLHKGDYLITNYIPDNYKIVFTWGEGTYTVQNYKGTVYDKDRLNEKEEADEHWYKINSEERNTDALDNFGIRQSIDDEMKEITYKNFDQHTQNKMDSATPDFKVEIEYEDDIIKSKNWDENGHLIPYEIKNIDFGIIRRAEQIIELKKNVSNFKITLPNGNTDLFNATIKEGKIEGSPSYVRYMPDKKGIITEIDNEIIQGATAEVTYTFTCENTSEKDYSNREYYLYGEKGNNYTDNIVKIVPSTIVDYLDNNWKYKSQGNTEWEVDENKNKEIIVKKQNGSQVTLNYNNKENVDDNVGVYYINSNTELEPGKFNSDISLTVTKLLSSNKDGITLDNDAEIIQVSKNGGSQIKWRPGNYVHNTNSTEGDDDKAEPVRIMPNTGKNLDYATPIIITIVMLGIITTGIILIKKKVLGNKN